MAEFSSESSADVLADEWERTRPIPLDGWIERQAFPPVLMAFVALVAAFILFQVIISPIATVLLLMAQGVAPDQMLSDLPALIEDHAASLLTANTIGQVFGLALPAYVFAWMHTSRPAAFLRVRKTDIGFVVLAFLALIAITPSIQWLGMINEHLPLPEAIRRFETSQLELIERVLSVDTGLFFNLVVLAITPALCEELLFRGYVQREAERGMGAMGGVLFSGIVFGLYHLRLTQILPLCVLGILLAYLVWRTGSLWPAVVVHFANNAIAVAIGAYISQRPELDLADIEQMNVPWYMIVVGIVVFVVIIAGIERIAARHAHSSRALEPNL